MQNPDFATPEVRELRRQVALACRILGHLGLADYLGHPSARIGDSAYVAIKAGKSERVRGMTAMGVEEILVVDVDGRQYVGDNPPPSELSLHLEIYRARPDVNAVVHTHQLLATCFGAVGRPIVPMLHLEGLVVSDGVATYPHAHLITTPERGRAMAAALGRAALLHLQGHGVVSTAASIQEATLATIRLERLAQANYVALALGTPRVIPPDELAQLRADVAGPASGWAYYSSLVQEPD